MNLHLIITSINRCSCNKTENMTHIIKLLYTFNKNKQWLHLFNIIITMFNKINRLFIKKKNIFAGIIIFF